MFYVYFAFNMNIVWTIFNTTTK